MNIFHAFRIVVYSLSLFYAPSCLSFFETFPTMQKENAFYKEQDGIALSALAMSKNECLRYFGIDLPQKGCRPILIHVSNKQSNALSVSKNYIRYRNSTETIPLVPIHRIIQYAQYKVFSLMIVMLTSALYYYWQAIPYGVLPLSFALFMYNKAAQKHLVEKTLDSESMVIQPFEEKTFFVFIPESHHISLFDLCVLNTEHKTLTIFHVDTVGSQPHIPGVAFE